MVRKTMTVRQSGVNVGQARKAAREGVEMPVFDSFIGMESGNFNDCGSSAANSAADDPQSRMAHDDCGRQVRDCADLQFR